MKKFTLSVLSFAVLLFMLSVAETSAQVNLDSCLVTWYPFNGNAICSVKNIF